MAVQPNPNETFNAGPYYSENYRCAGGGCVTERMAARRAQLIGEGVQSDTIFSSQSACPGGKSCTAVGSMTYKRISTQQKT